MLSLSLFEDVERSLLLFKSSEPAVATASKATIAADAEADAETAAEVEAEVEVVRGRPTPGGAAAVVMDEPEMLVGVASSSGSAHESNEMS